MSSRAASSRAETFKTRKSRRAFELPRAKPIRRQESPDEPATLARLARNALALTPQRVAWLTSLLLIFPMTQTESRGALFAPASLTVAGVGAVGLAVATRMQWGLAAFDRVLGTILACAIPAMYSVVDRGDFYSSASMWTVIAGFGGVILAVVTWRSALSVTEALGLVGILALARMNGTDAALIATGIWLGLAMVRFSRARRVGLSFLVALTVVGCISARYDLSWPIGQINYLSVLVAMTWSATLADQIQRRRLRPSFAFCVTSIAMVYLVLSHGRGQTALVIGFWLLVLAFRFMPKGKRAWVAIGMTTTLIVGAGFVPWKAVLAHPKIGARLEIYQVAAAGIAESPWFGEGVWGMHRALEHAPAARAHFWTYEQTNLSNAHNLILHALVQMGIVGTAVVALTFAFAIRRSRIKATAPVVAAFVTWIVVGQVSIAPWTVVGLLSAGFFWGYLREQRRNNTAESRKADEPGTVSAKSTVAAKSSARPALGVIIRGAPTCGLLAGIVLLGVVRPLQAQWVTENPDRHAAENLDWSLWNEESYNRYLTHVNFGFLQNKRYQDLYELQCVTLERYGNRRTGWGRASRAAFYVGQRDLGAKHAMQQLDWTPLIVAVDREVAHLSKAFRFPWGEETQACFDGLDREVQRNIIAIAIRPRIDQALIEDLTSRPDVSVPDLGFLLIVAKLRPDVPIDIRRMAVKRLRQEYPHWDVPIALESQLATRATP